MLRSSSGRTACASRANGSRRRSISRTPMYLSGTICTEKPGGSARDGAAELRRHVAAHGGRLRHDEVHAAALHHRRAVHAQQRLERRRQRLARNAGGRAHGHRAADRGIDRVGLVEDVAQDVAHDLAQVRAFEVEHDCRRPPRLYRRRGGHAAARACCPFTTTPVAAVDVRLELLLRRRHAGLRARPSRRRASARRAAEPLVTRPSAPRRVSPGAGAAPGTRRGSSGSAQMAAARKKS